jgi:ubiquitin-protein ligase
LEIVFKTVPPVAFLAKRSEKVEAVLVRLMCATDMRKLPMDVSLWKDLRKTGDGYETGTYVSQDLEAEIGKFAASGEQRVELEVKDYYEWNQPHTLNRMDATKQLFHAFINRSLAYDYPAEIGLVLCGSTVDTTCALTPLYEDFREKIDAVKPKGDTALYDSVHSAIEALKVWRSQPGRASDAALRVLVISDGKDTCSSHSASAVTREAQRVGAVVDAIMIGVRRKDEGAYLGAIAKATGGLVFEPQTLATALRLNELEVLLSAHERPDRPKLPAVSNETDLKRYFNESAYPTDRCSEDVVPPHRPWELNPQPTRALDEVVEAPPPEHSIFGPLPQQGLRRLRRIMAELRSFARKPHPALDIFPAEGADLSTLKILLTGPEHTPYTGGVWLIGVRLPEDYPDRAPEVRFLTPIRHCNINAYGRVCHSVLDRNYGPDTSLRTVMECIYGLLLNPDYDDPLDSGLALEFYQGSGTYEDSIRQHVTRHATQRTRRVWKQLLAAGKAVPHPGAGTAHSSEEEEEEEEEDDSDSGSESIGSTDSL